MTGTMAGMEENDIQELAETVREARLAAGLSKEGVARKAEVSSITYKRVEDAERVQDASLAKILAALDLRWPGRRAALEVEVDTAADVPVGAGVDPEVLAELAQLEPEKVQRVKDFIRGIKSGG